MRASAGQRAGRYGEAAEGDVLLTGMLVAILKAAGWYGAWKGDLDRV